MVTFGIVPTHPETGYGYVKSTSESPSSGCHRVAAFVEKPDLSTAEAYLREGGYFWNSGMFMFKASTYLDELRAHQPLMLASCQKALAAAKSDLDFVRLEQAGLTPVGTMSAHGHPFGRFMRKTLKAMPLVAMSCWKA
jgi:mannose-1-phosphate guanylyltransferase